MAEPRTPDEVRIHIATCMGMGLGEACPPDFMDDEEDRQRQRERIQKWADWIHAQYAPFLGDPQTWRAER